MIPHPDTPPDEQPACHRFAVGLDIAQVHDASALAIVKKSWAINSSGRAENAAYHCGFLHKWKLGTRYDKVIDDTKSICKNAQLIGSARINGRWRKFLPTLAVDRTGVGSPIFEQLTTSGSGLNAYGICFTGGESFHRVAGRRYNLPKKDAVAKLTQGLQSGTLTISKGLEHAPAMLRELKSFKVKIKPSGHEVLEHAKASDHDDLLIAVSMALWVLDHAPIQMDEVELFWK
jgi:hypothetical protein